MRDRHDSGFLAGAALVAHIDCGGGVVADHHDGEPGPAEAAAFERVRPGADLAPELLRDPLAIDDLRAHMPAALLKSPMACDEHRDGFTLRRRQVRVPDVDDQHDARARAAVPGLVLVGVVEYDRVAFAPFVLLAADDERAVLRNDERQVTDDARVGDAAVRQDMRARRQHREHHLGRVLADAHERQRLQTSPRCVGTARDSRRAARHAGRNRSRSSWARRSRPASPVLGRVALEDTLAALRARHHRHAFLANRVRLALEGPEPGKFRSLEVRAQPAGREIQDRRLLARIRRRARSIADLDREAFLEARERLAAVPRETGSSACPKTRRRPAFT